MEELSLDAIGILDGTDKTSLEQDYLRHYERVFAAWRHEPIQLLEIGIASGSSLRSWSTFFSRAKIIGVDINESCRTQASERITVEIGSQADPEFLRQLGERYHPSIIIDDGSHFAEHILLTFSHLFPCLLPGGIYIIEDLHLHVGANMAQWHSGGGLTPVEFFGKAASRIAGDYFDSDNQGIDRETENSIDSVEFIRRALIIRKRPRQENPDQRVATLWKLVAQSNSSLNWFHLSHVLMEHSDLDRAKSAAENAIALSPENPHLLVRLGHIQWLQGDLRAAVESTRQAVQLVPDNIGFRSMLTKLEGQLPSKPGESS